MSLTDINAVLLKAGREGATAWWDGYDINATTYPAESLARTAFENGWKRARELAIAQGLALPGADNSQHPGSR